MKVVITTKNVELAPVLKDFITRKISSLEKFSELFQPKKYFDGFFGKGKPRIEAWVEIAKTTLRHKKGPIFRVECQMRFPGKSLRSETRSEDLRIAIVQIKDELQRQMKQYKNKIMAKTKRGSLEFKKSLHLSHSVRFKIKKLKE